MATLLLDKLNIKEHLEENTSSEEVIINGKALPQFTNEFWTPKQRQANSIHEIAYRACFKPLLPEFFIKLLSQKEDLVYDPFAGRGTTVIQAGLMGRNVIANDINPLSEILCYPRLAPPYLSDIETRLTEIKIDEKAKAEIDLLMFYHPQTEAEIVSLKDYLQKRKETNKEDNLDRWIRMTATNRLTGHSKGFFSVYTLPPNQAVMPENQRKINEKKKQKPDYRDTKKIILKKSKDLLRDISEEKRKILHNCKAKFLTKDARNTAEIESETVQLTVTSPPFLDVVQYANDNWLRCWFNSLDVKEIAPKLTMAKNINDWCLVMGDVFKELYRITKRGGWVIFEVGEVRNGKIKLEEHVVPLGITAGFVCEGIMINLQKFTKTSNIWGVKNNEKGTNSNRVVIFTKNKLKA